MDRKRRVHTIISSAISSAAIAATIFAGALPAQAQIGGFGTSSAGGSGGTATGPTNFTGIYGQSSSGGSGGFSTGPTNFSTSGFGLSTGAGSGARATGPTNPALPQFGATSSGTRAFGGGPNLGSGALGVPNIMVPEASGSSQPSPPGTGR
jgi:hypothetical protein